MVNTTCLAAIAFEVDGLPDSRNDMREADIARALSDDETVYNAYIDEIRAILSDATPEDFTPPLDVVEAVFGSFAIEPTSR